MPQTLQQFIIEDLNVKAVINPAIEYKNRVDALKNMLKASKRKGFVLEVAGDQSSALAGHIAQAAVRELRKETGDLQYMLLALYLPEGQPSTKETTESTTVIKNFIKVDEVIGHDISQRVAAMEQAHPELANDRGQMKTRVRTTVQHMYAQDRNLMVAGSGNSAEHVLGEATRRGETTISDVLPLAGLSRHQVNQMLHLLKAPAFLLANVPSVSAAGIDFASVDAYLGGASGLEAGKARQIEQKFLTTEHTRREANPFFTKFDHYKFMNESRLLAVG